MLLDVYARQATADGQVLWFRWPKQLDLNPVDNLDLDTPWSTGADGERISIHVIRWVTNLVSERSYVWGTVHALGQSCAEDVRLAMSRAGFTEVTAPA